MENDDNVQLNAAKSPERAVKARPANKRRYAGGQGIHANFGSYRPAVKCTKQDEPWGEEREYAYSTPRSEESELEEELKFSRYELERQRERRKQRLAILKANRNAGISKAALEYQASLGGDSLDDKALKGGMSAREIKKAALAIAAMRTKETEQE